MTDKLPELDREVLMAWGLDDRSRRGSRPGLSLVRITRAAITIAGRQGLAAISMARVATALGFTTMSLYRYVDSKDQLLTLMVDAAAGPAPKSRHQGDDWRAGLATWTRSLMEVYAAHPWMIEVAITGAPLLPNQLDWMDWALAIMQATALTPAERVSTLQLLSGYVRNEVRLTADIERGRAASGRTPATEEERYWRALTTLVPRDRMPALYALVTANPSDPTMPVEAESDIDLFEFGLNRILDGLEHYIARRASER